VARNHAGRLICWLCCRPRQFSWSPTIIRHHVREVYLILAYRMKLNGIRSGLWGGRHHLHPGYELSLSTWRLDPGMVFSRKGRRRGHWERSLTSRLGDSRVARGHRKPAAAARSDSITRIAACSTASRGITNT
jgi:hypothetical protein